MATYNKTEIDEFSRSLEKFSGTGTTPGIALEIITQLRAELAARDAELHLCKAERTYLRDKYGAARELFREILEYRGGAEHALADEYVVARIDAALKGDGDE